jgi:hypothetical protein
MPILFILSLLLQPVFAGKILNEAIRINPYALPGDSERNHLMLDGVNIHEANDFYGKTDKLITETGSISVMGIWKKYFSSSIQYKGRFVQPVLRTRNTENQLETPIGIHAEWVEIGANQSVTFFEDDSWIALKLEAGLSYNDFGDHNFSQLYKGVHNFLGVDNDLHKFGKRIDTNFYSSRIASSLIFPIGDHINFLVSYQVLNSKIFREDSTELSVIWSISKDLAFSYKYSFVSQIRSEYYDLTNRRTQYIVAARFFKIWTPSIMHISPYVRGDRYGQWYLSPLSLTWPF